MNQSNANTWILLRGFAREQRHWEDFPQILGQTLPDIKILTPDLPGNGIQFHRNSPVNIQGMLAAVRADLSDEIRGRPVNLLALSMGSMVAIEWMTRYAKECANAVLINPCTNGLLPFYNYLQPRYYWSIFSSVLLTSSIEKREQFIFDMTSNLNPDKQKIVDSWVRYANGCPVAKDNAMVQFFAATRYHIPPKKPDTPMLILKSSRDRLFNPHCTENLAKQWGLPVQSHPEAGHDMPLDDPQWVCDEIKKWLHDETA